MGGSTIETSARDAKKRTKTSLRILQWNADGIRTKANELQLRLKESDCDVCVIQESKLRQGIPTPKIEGYTSVRTDRPRMDGGGGLLTYIRDSLVFERTEESCLDGTETSSIRVRIGKRKWATITNVYCPPTRSHSHSVSALRMDRLPTSSESIVCGDFNAHNKLWDPLQPCDVRGNDIVDWILENDLTILNDGSHTRLNTRLSTETPPPTTQSNTPSSTKTPTGGKSTPDLTIVGSMWNHKCTWQTVEDIGSSDHTPIMININAPVDHGSVFKGQIAWKTNGVDWTSYTEALERALELIDLPSDATVHSRYKAFHTAIIETATKTVGTIKPGRRTRSWETPAVREAIRRRNRLRKSVRTNRSEWVEACRSAQETIAEAKTEAWKKVLEESANSPDDGKMWRIVKSLNGTPESNSPNEAMVHEGKLITSHRRKADIFANHYAKVSSLRMNKHDRTENRQLKALLRQYKNEDTAHHPSHYVTLSELKLAISKMKTRGAPGPDNISPPLLKHLGPRALDELLSIFNESLRSSEIPQIWRNATIIPLLKSGKSPASLASFRPISLTSCVMKLLERVISDRLFDLAERNNWFSGLQAGFRRSRGVEDQILRMSQRISDGFHRREKSVMVLLDFSKAYDTIWRQRLLLTLSKRGVPPAYTIWLNSFLSNRQARVRFNGYLSKSKKMGQGLPQGSVLAPVLFLFYINELATLLPSNVTTSLYADDVTILASSADKETARVQAQEAVDIVQEWSHQWKLNLNSLKSETTIFSTSTADASWRPRVTINGDPLRYEPHPKLLGVIFDRKLLFSKQVEEVKARVASKMRLLGAVAHSKWGWRKEDLRKIYTSHIQSVMTFASSAWQPWLSNTRIKELESTQNKCLRLITSQYRSAPVEALRVESGIPSITSVIKGNNLRSYEKAMRLPSDHPRSIAALGSAPTRLKSYTGFRNKAIKLCNESGLNSYMRTPLLYHSTRPWERGLKPNTVFPHLEGITGKGDSAPKIRAAALRRTQELNAQFNIYTDGSASAGVLKGGAGVVITTGDPTNPTISDKLQQKGSGITCSFDEELRAMQMTLDWVDEHLDISNTVAVYTDSQSLCMALVGDGVGLDPMRSRINNTKADITIQWIPGHCEILGNDLADETAKLAAKSPGPGCPVTYGSACSHIRSYTRDPPPTHPRVKEVYAAFSQDRERRITSRRDQSLLAQLRSGHYIGLREYEHRIGRADSPVCNLCNQGDQDLQHWLVECPATEAQRFSLFGSHSGRLDCLTRFPREVVTLARETLGDH